MTLALDALSPDELRSLDVAQQIDALNDLLGEVKTISDVKKRAIIAKKVARIRLLRDKKNVEAQVGYAEAVGLVEELACEIAARKEQAKILQTLINTEARLAR